MSQVTIHQEVPPQMTAGEWTLCFQRVTYHYDDPNDDPEDGYRFIWRRPDGSLQAARGQSRILSLRAMNDLIKQATEDGFFKDESLV